MQETQKASFSFKEIASDAITPDIKPEKFTSYDNAEIAYYRFTATNPTARLIFLHGGGAHSKMGYFPLAGKLANEFAVETILMDIRGHGFSEGNRGDCPHTDSVYKDISQLIKLVRDNLPVYLGGHSSGGGLVLNYSSWAQKEKPDGYFFVSPELGYKSKTEKPGRTPFAKVKLGPFIINGMTGGKLEQHSFAVSFNYPDEIISANPLIVKNITVNMANALTPPNPVKQFQDIHEPVGLYIGENDELFDISKVMDYVHLVKNKNVKSKVIENENHLSILNVVADEIGKTISEWQGISKNKK